MEHQHQYIGHRYMPQTPSFATYTFFSSDGSAGGGDGYATRDDFRGREKHKEDMERRKKERDTEPRDDYDYEKSYGNWNPY